MSERMAAAGGSGGSSWIVSPSWDFSFLIASPLLIIPLFSLLSSTVIAPENLALLVFAFATLGHHLPGYMRAYGDRALFARYRARFILAPVLVYGVTLGLFIQPWRGGESPALMSPELLLVLWGTWHGLMQAYGLMRLYDAKQTHERAMTQQLDLALCVGLFASGVVLVDGRLFALLDLFGRAGLPLFPVAWLPGVKIATGVVLSLLITVYLANTWVEHRRGRRMGLVKFTLAMSAGGVYAFTGLATSNLVVGFAMFEVYHALQYYGIVWVFNRKLHDRVGDGFGALGFLFRDRWSMLALYVLCIAAFGSLLLLVASPGSNQISLQTLPYGNYLGPLVGAFYVTSGVLHYYFDGFIWKFRDRETARDFSPSWQLHKELSVPAFVHVAKWGALFIALVALVGIEQSRPWDSERERAHLNTLARFTPDVPEINSRRIPLALENGQIEAALAMAEKSAVMRPRARFAQLDLAVAREAAGDDAGAAKAFAVLAELAPEEIDPLIGMARALARSGPARSNEAVAAYQDLIEREPDAHGLRRELVDLHSARGDEQAAIEVLRALLAKNPAAHGDRLRLVRMLGRSGSVGPALAVARDGVASAPESATAQMAHGWALLAADKPNRALKALEEAQRLDPELTGLHFELGRAQLAAGLLENAEQSFLQVLSGAGRQSPVMAHYYLSRVFDGTGRPDRAMRQRNTFIRRAPSPAAGQLQLGDLLSAEGEIDAAERAYRGAIADEARLAPAHVALGMLLWNKGEPTSAREHLQRAQSLGARLPPRAQQILVKPQAGAS